ncbi:MAG TPA: hypothetical protein VHE37_09060 [Nevskiaceae bacterium]|nr:hypothetical protein [Nevskiaceae bacterium]
MAAQVRGADLRGYSRLVIDATVKITDLVEAMHAGIARPQFLFGKPAPRTDGITGLVYQSVRTISTLVGAGIDSLLELAAPLVDAAQAHDASPYVREGVQALLNGVIGDHLEHSGNPLAIRMSLRRNGISIAPDTRAIVEAIPEANGKLLILAHGLCMNDLEFNWKGHDHGAMLARERGWTPVYLHYNSGRHVSQNGREFADQLEALVRAWPMPLEEIAILGFSMGGLVARSACHYGAQAQHSWLQHLKRIVFVGTPHHGAPLERGGNHFHQFAASLPFAGPLARLGAIRSAGVTDLRHGNLLDQDWQDCGRFEHHHDRRTPVPLPDGVRCYALAASTGERAGDLSDTLLGDGIVFLNSALGRHDDPRRALSFDDHCTHFETGHLGMLDSRAVYATIRTWLT